MPEIRCGHKTDIGRAREVNQDSVAIVRSDGLQGQADTLAVVADGMGGRAGGGVASCLTTQVLPPAVLAHLWAECGERTRETFADALFAGLTAANGAVWKRAREETALRGMGTTCVAALIREDLAVIGSAGDSRVYLLRAGALTQVTHDHVLIYDSKVGGQESADQTESRFHNTITRAIGFGATLQPDITLLRLSEGDRLLLCSDGLTNMVAHDAIASLLGAESDPQSASERLVESANSHGGEDNVSVVVLDYGSFRPIAPSPRAPAAAEFVPPTTIAPKATARSRWWSAAIALLLIAGFAIALYYLLRPK